MVDPRKIHDFLTRTLASLNAAKNAGDGEATLRLEPLMDRGNALAAKAISQQEQMQQAPAPQLPQVGAGIQPSQQRSPAQLQQLGRQTDANVKASTAAMGNPEGVDQTERAEPLGGNSEFDNIVRSLQVASAPSLPVTRHHQDQPGPRYMRSEEVAPTLERLSQPPQKVVAKKDEVSRLAEFVKQKPQEQPAGEFEAVATVEPAEEDAVARIRKMVGEKPSAFTLENLAMLFLFGAPRTFAKIQADSKNWEETLRQLVATDAKEKKEERRHRETVGFREREVSANEKRASTDEAKAVAGNQSGNLRSMISAAKGIVNATNADPGSDEYKDAVRFLSAIRPQMPEGGVPGVPK